METEHKSQRTFTRREMLEICGLGVGMTSMVGSLIYKTFATPSEPFNLARYTEIEKELGKYSWVRLENLESESPKLIARANELRAERDAITIDPDFAKVRDTYESERDKVLRISNYSLIGGVAIVLLSIGSASIRSMRRILKDERSEDNQPPFRAF